MYQHPPETLRRIGRIRGSFPHTAFILESALSGNNVAKGEAINLFKDAVAMIGDFELADDIAAVIGLSEERKRRYASEARKKIWCVPQLGDRVKQIEDHYQL